MIYFISGHLDLDPDLFKIHYHQLIQEAIRANGCFIIGDANGVDLMAQEYLIQQLNPSDYYRITIYHMFDKPRNLLCPSIKTLGGFKSDNERDSKMTLDSDLDIAYVRSEEESRALYGSKFRPNRISGTQKNLDRRIQKNNLHQ